MIENVPSLIWFSSATTQDKKFLEKLKLEKGKIAVFDKGYNAYSTFDEFIQKEIYFVTRLKSNASYETVSENDIPKYMDNGVIKDEIISVEIKEKAQYKKTLELRKIAYWDDQNKAMF